MIIRKEMELTAPSLVFVSACELKSETVHKVDMLPMSKGRIMKNLIVVCLGFLFLFSAYQSLANLQSTMNSVLDLGVVSQSIIYAALIVSSLFVPKLLIKRFGCKMTLIGSILTYCPYIAANFYPRLETFVPTSIIIGLGAAPLWISKCTYLNELSALYAEYGPDSTDVIISRFFGIFFMVFQNTQIWGNLVSYYVLKSPNSYFETYEISNSSLEDCGVWFFNGTNPNLDPPSVEKRFTLVGIYLGFAILAALIVGIFLDPIDRKDSFEDEKESVCSRAVATLTHMRKPKQLLLIPLTIFSGIEQAFILSEYTKAYVACAWGVHHVGFVFICFGVVSATMSLLSGRLLKYMPRLPIMMAAAVGNVVTCVGLFLWKPRPEYSAYFFVIAGIWGFSDAIWQTQINALYGVLFKKSEEAGFSNYRLWESMGFSIAFAYSQFLVVAYKIYVLLAFLVVGMAGYVIVEINSRPKKVTHKMKCVTNK